MPVSEATGSDFDHMSRALDLARRGDKVRGASPIGCVIVKDGQVIAEGHNEVGLRHDPTAHAEIVAIRRACEALGTEDLRGAALYSTLQPCGMCTMAVIWSHVSRVVYAAGRDDVHEMYFEDRHLDTMNFVRDGYRDDLVVVSGVMRDAAKGLYWGPDDDPPPEEQANT